MAKPAPPPPATPRAATAPAQSAHPGRPKTTGRDLPPRLLRKTKRLVSGAVWTGYYYQGRDDEGRRVQIPLGTDLTAAKRRWAELEAKTTAHAPPRTLASVFDRYLKEVVPLKAPRTQKEYQALIRHLRQAFDAAECDRLTPRAIAIYRDARGQVAPVRANREITLLGTIYQKAREWGLATRPNPVTGVAKLPERPRDYYLDDQVWAALLAEAVDELRDAMELAYLTGQRPGDVLRMRLSDVRDNALEVRQGKTRMRLRILLDHPDGSRTDLGKLIDRVKARRVAAIGGNIVMTSAGKAVTAPMLRIRFEAARAAAALKAETGGGETVSAGDGVATDDGPGVVASRQPPDPDLAARIRTAHFADLRSKAASEITSLTQASNLLGHTHEEITKKVYIRRGKEVLPVR